MTTRLGGAVTGPVHSAGRHSAGQLLCSRTPLDLCTIGGLWVLQTLLANPTGEFPLNDDWSYSRSVQTLVSQGRLELSGFTAMPLLAQVLWGSLFCLPFGFSFTALRLSTWLLGFVGLVATYGLLRARTASRALVLLATLLLAANPLYFALSLTFMTDVPFLTLSVASLVFLTYGLRNNGRLYLVLGFALAVLALLIRQLAAAIPVAFALAYLAVHGLNRRTLLFGLLSVISALAVLRIYQVLIRSTIGLPGLYNRPYDPILETTPLNVVDIASVLFSRTLTELVYVGVFVLPLALVVAATRWRGASAKSRLWATSSVVAVFAAVGGGLLSAGQLMPLSGNVLYSLGVGPPLLRDVYLLGLPHLPQAPPAFWLAVTAGGIVGGILLVQQALTAVARLGWRAGRHELAQEGAPIILAASAGALYVGFAAAAGFLDRYLIWLVPLLMVCVVAACAPDLSGGSRWFTYAAGALVAGYSVFSVAASHDYFSWNRSRWQALNYLTQDLQISPTEIDGGFEFNGWYGYDRSYRERAGVSWWWVQNDDYVVAFGPLDGYSEILRFPYERWLPAGQGDIVVLRKLGRADAPADGPES